MAEASKRLRCNSCKTVRQSFPGQGLRELREDLASVGWASSPVNDVDLCPTCRAVPKQNILRLIQQILVN